ncbi:MAG: spermidine/putrescine ABC transporter substrate-binding protein [Desulfobacteraceae bacterium CG2_30_51_40]|nr:MAG: spermidine/putrescine ABC transporter substrate-binding protein [Desulfobacteraceae bacterium CG2_30_51_40]
MIPGALVVCPFCGCGCVFHLAVRDGRAVGITPINSHPVSRGSLCIKGWKAHEFINHPARLRSPLIREHGIVREASWDEALDLVAKRLCEIKEKHGGNALGFFSSAKVTNEENYLFMKMARAAFGSNNIDHCARL